MWERLIGHEHKDTTHTPHSVQIIWFLLVVDSEMVLTLSFSLYHSLFSFFTLHSFYLSTFCLSLWQVVFVASKFNGGNNIYNLHTCIFKFSAFILTNKYECVCVYTLYDVRCMCTMTACVWYDNTWYTNSKESKTKVWQINETIHINKKKILVVLQVPKWLIGFSSDLKIAIGHERHRLIVFVRVDVFQLKHE